MSQPKQKIRIRHTAIVIEGFAVKWVDNHYDIESDNIHDAYNANFDGVIEGALLLLRSLNKEGVVISEEQLKKSMAKVYDAALDDTKDEGEE